MPPPATQHDRPAAVVTVRRPTLEQVAAHAGVSRATASRVVNEVPTVDPQIVMAVNRAIAELNYVPNQAARTLVTRRLDTVVLIAAESTTRVFGDPYFSGILRGVSRELRKAGVHLVLSMASVEEDVAHAERFLRGGHVDGALLISEHDSMNLLHRLLETGIPLVVGGRPLSVDVNTVFVDFDNARGAELAVEHLISLGRNRIGSVAGPQDMSAGLDRLAGFKRAMGASFDPDLIEIGDFTTPSGVECTARLLRRRPDLDALFVASDLMALGAISAIASAGKRVPQDVAVIGFDDIEMAAIAAPPLTTVRQRTIEQGRLMAQVLLKRLGRKVADPMPQLEFVFAGSHTALGAMLDVELIVRASA